MLCYIVLSCPTLTRKVEISLAIFCSPLLSSAMFCSVLLSFAKTDMSFRAIRYPDVLVLSC